MMMMMTYMSYMCVCRVCIVTYWRGISDFMDHTTEATMIDIIDYDNTSLSRWQPALLLSGTTLTYMWASSTRIRVSCMHMSSSCVVKNDSYRIRVDDGGIITRYWPWQAPAAGNNNSMV